MAHIEYVGTRPIGAAYPVYSQETTAEVDGVLADNIVVTQTSPVLIVECDVPAGVSTGQVFVTVTHKGQTTPGFPFQVPHDMAGTALLSGNLDSALFNPRTIEGTATLSGNLTSALSRLHELTGQAPLSGNLDSDLKNSRTLLGTAVLSGSLNSALVAIDTQQLSGTALLSGNLETQLNRTHHLEGTASLSGNLDSTLSRTHHVSGDARLSGNLDSLLNADDEPRRITGTVLLSGNLDSALSTDVVFPVIESIPDFIQREMTLFEYQVVASHPLSLPLSYSLSVAPAGMTISETGLISWLVQYSQTTTAVTVAVTDNTNTSFENFSITTTRFSFSEETPQGQRWGEATPGDQRWQESPL